MFHPIAALLFIVAAAPALAADGFSLSSNRQFILAPAAGPGLMKQCSRDSPKSSGSYWKPTAADLKAFQTGLSRYLKVRVATGEPVPPPRAYHGQYVGIVQRGRKVIYGNFYARQPDAPFDESSTPVVACDGGPSFWGIVFDPTSRTFDQLRFNGP